MVKNLLQVCPLVKFCCDKITSYLQQQKFEPCFHFLSVLHLRLCGRTSLPDRSFFEFINIFKLMNIFQIYEQFLSSGTFFQLLKHYLISWIVSIDDPFFNSWTFFNWWTFFETHEKFQILEQFLNSWNIFSTSWTLFKFKNFVKFLNISLNSWLILELPYFFEFESI